MSCKVLPPGAAPPEAPVEWRQVRQSDLEPAEMPAAATARLAQMERDCNRRVQEAHVAGVREGAASGRQQASAELQPVMARLARSIDEMGGMRARFRREAEADLIGLSIAIARRVLRRELAVDPEALHGLILAALEKLSAQEIRRVKVHPSHAAMVSACLRESGGGAVDVIPDPTREPGSVIFETERGNLDASVESQLREIERGLTDRMKRQS